MKNIQNLDLRFYAIISLLVLWASLTFSIALTEIAFVCALIFWVGWHIQLKGTGTFFLKKEKSACPPTDLVFWTPLGLFFLIVLISFFTSEYPKESVRGLYKIAKPLLAFIMIVNLFRNTGSRKQFDGIFLATFLLVVIDCSIQYAFGKDLLRGFAAEHSAAGIRLVGPFGNFAKMATYLILVIPVFVLSFGNSLAQKNGWKKSIYPLCLLLASFTLLYLTRCRAPVIALVLSLSALLIFKRWFKTLGIFLLLCLVLLAIMPQNVLFHRNAQGRETSVRQRLYFWHQAIDVIVAKPFTGTGINTYDRAHAKYQTIWQKNFIPITGPATIIQQNPDGSVSFITGEEIYTSDKSQQTLRVREILYSIFRDSKGRYFVWHDYVPRGYYAHNGYLQLSAEIGLPGIFCFLCFLFMFFRRTLGSVKRIRDKPEEFAQLGLLTALLAFLLYAAVDNNLQSPPSFMMFWYLAGILVARQNQTTETASA